MSELKPCPFCGTNNVGFEVCHTEGSHWVECDECHAMSTPNYSPQSATMDWNNRPHEDKIKADAVRNFLCENVPLLDDEGLNPEYHHCEFALLEERERIHNLANKLEQGEA